MFFFQQRKDSQRERKILFDSNEKNEKLKANKVSSFSQNIGSPMENEPQLLDTFW